MSNIRLHNSLSRKKENFAPIDPKNVRMYVCGPTVYDRAHLGNARPVVVFDTLFRLLREIYGEEHVTYVRNFTDVDDKINIRASETGRDIRDITNETIAWYHDDMDALGALRPSQEPRATDYIQEMIDMIEELIAKNHAYAAQNHVLFRVDAFDGYGKLSGRSIDDMIAGARVEVAPYKENPMDFVLWKPSGSEEPGWDSPWGYGRPGWHIECSAMARDILGQKFDIHAGGLDLQFPHHENEIAQSQACCGADSFAQIWMHNEMLQVEGKKMSKSLGNFFTVRELLDQGYSGDVVRFVFLSTHYSKPMDWTAEKAGEAKVSLHEYIAQIAQSADLDVALGLKPLSDLTDALSDDLNTHAALMVVKSLDVPEKSNDLARALTFLGLYTDDEIREKVDTFNAQTKGLVSLADEMSAIRSKAMETKNFSELDEMKSKLSNAGVSVRMSKEGIELYPSANFDAAALEGL